MWYKQISISSVTKVLRNPSFWLIVIVLVLITIPHYGEVLKHPAFITNISTNLGLSRHSFERILYLAPIIWATFLFGQKGAIITSLVVLLCMLPRAIFLSPDPKEALFESGAVFVIGNLLNLSFVAVRKERAQRTQLEVTHRELVESEQRYRTLFENAHDAIWVQDMEGNILAANEASAKQTGYDVETLVHMTVVEFLPPESLEIARDVRQRLLRGEILEPYEQRIIRKDGTEMFLRLSSSLIRDAGKSVAFQHIARDVTEEKRMQENLRFYLQQTTRAQEEERKRISRELHDDTIQALIVLSRQLDSLASNGEGLSEKNRARLEELRQKTNDIVQGVRRLSQDLRPAVLGRLGLLSSLEWLTSDMAGYSGMATKINVHGTERRLTEEKELLLFRITQEALRNVWKHSGATQAEVTVEFDDQKTSITISDNGKGFDIPKAIGDLARYGKLGLAGMQERAQLLGGTLKVKSQLGKGTEIIVELPV